MTHSPPDCRLVVFFEREMIHAEKSGRTWELAKGISCQLKPRTNKLDKFTQRWNYWFGPVQQDAVLIRHQPPCNLSAVVTQGSTCQSDDLQIACNPRISKKSFHLCSLLGKSTDNFDIFFVLCFSRTSVFVLFIVDICVVRRIQEERSLFVFHVHPAG